MKRGKLKRALAIAVIVVLCLSVFSALGLQVEAQQSSADWPMFHHAAEHTGLTTSTVPMTNRTLWKFTTGGKVFSSPAVSDGVVYVGSFDGKVYALNALTGV
jgi:hypothetical protein